ncbi:MAG: sulfatase-like hydrolase/transferase [Burkholderiaceae bacterium]|nr:sulfatase-like hydrolase/transferase [Burkholderiaceae bacterium]
MWHSALAISGFFAFVLAYYAPSLSALEPLVDLPQGVGALAFDALSRRPVQLEALRNVLLGHLFPLLALYLALRFLANRFTDAVGLRPALSRLILFIGFWFVLVAGNRLAFPLSDYSLVLDSVAGPVMFVGGTLIVALAAIVVASTMIPKKMLPTLLGISIVTALTASANSGRSIPTAVAPESRNVIMIGIDSLSARVLQNEGERFPNLAALLSQGTTFERAYTPLGRTFPAWASILSGRAPADHRAVFNLRGVEHVDRSDLLPHTFREAGYRTVFAIDERRFSNIDESFGFDRTVGPKVGALDFLLQRFNDAPLSNLLLQTRLGRFLLPYSWLNTASYANYNERAFVEETVAALTSAPKVFLAVHFESAHYPYKSRYARPDNTDPDRLHAGYVAALAVVDGQVGQLVLALRNRGYLEDALVVVLSDHGESLGGIEGEISGSNGRSKISAFGHGAEILSEDQSRVVLSLVPFRNGRALAKNASVRTDQVSLTDLRAAVEHYIDTGKVRLTGADSCMTVETGIRFAAAEDFHALDERKLASDGAGYYEIDPRGRLRLRESILPTLVRTKDVGLRCSDRITYYSPAFGDYIAYRIDDSGRRLIPLQPARDDIERIDAYRARILLSVGG